MSHLSASSTSSKPCSFGRWTMDVRPLCCWRTCSRSRPKAATRHLELSPQQRKEKNFQALLDQLAGLATGSRSLTLYEDVHWADPTTLDFLGRVVERVQRLPVLVVVTFRPGSSRPGRGTGTLPRLSLGRLGRRMGGTMVGRVTAARHFRRRSWSRFWRGPTGCRLFIEELTKAVLESGVLAERGDRYTHEGPLPALAIPAIYTTRSWPVSTAGPVKTLAQIAACIGRESRISSLRR